MSDFAMLGHVVAASRKSLRNKLTLEKKKLPLEFMHAAFLFTEFLLSFFFLLFCSTHFVNDRNQIANE